MKKHLAALAAALIWTTSSAASATLDVVVCHTHSGLLLGSLSIERYWANNNNIEWIVRNNTGRTATLQVTIEPGGFFNSIIGPRQQRSFHVGQQYAVRGAKCTLD